MLIVSCPICHNSPATPALEEYTVTVQGESTLGGLCVYQCPDGHVFFLREADLGAVSVDVTAA